MSAFLVRLSVQKIALYIGILNQLIYDRLNPFIFKFIPLKSRILTAIKNILDFNDRIRIKHAHEGTDLLNLID